MLIKSELHYLSYLKTNACDSYSENGGLGRTLPIGNTDNVYIVMETNSVRYV